MPSASTSASAAASNNPRFAPCPASGCTTCAASPTSATRAVTYASADRRHSGNFRRSLASRTLPSAPSKSRSSSRSNASGCAASSVSARAVGTDHTMELCASLQWQEGERAVAEESLPRGVFMRTRGAHHGDDGGLAIVGARGRRGRRARARATARRRRRPPGARAPGARRRCSTAASRSCSSAVTSPATSATPARRAAPASAACSTLFSAITPRSRSPISAASNTSASPPCGGTSACHTCMRS